MRKNVLNNQKGSYRKLFISIAIVSFCIFISSSFNRDVSSILISLGVFLAALKQVFIPINLNRNISSSKVYSISDDDFIKIYNSIGNPDPFNIYDKANIWHRLIMFGEKVSFLLGITGILYDIFI